MRTSKNVVSVTDANIKAIAISRSDHITFLQFQQSCLIIDALFPQYLFNKHVVITFCFIIIGHHEDA